MAFFTIHTGTLTTSSVTCITFVPVKRLNMSLLLLISTHDGVVGAVSLVFGLLPLTLSLLRSLRSFVERWLESVILLETVTTFLSANARIKDSEKTSALLVILVKV